MITTALALGLVWVNGAAMASEELAWPLDPPKVITSSFGEYRAGRFHAGIDLRISRIGAEAYACGSGYISRVRCSPFGYGKAVYLTLDAGGSAVYAHLDDFTPEVLAYVREEQHQRRSYSVDLEPEPGRFRVERGAIVAYAGSSGTSAPHLHFEPRDAGNRPINPRLLGMSWPDSTAPVFRSLLMVPADAQSTVNGDILPVALPVQSSEPGRYTVSPVRLSGHVGLGADVIDPANEGSSILGAYILRTVIDGSTVFEIRNDYLSYETMGHGTVAWLPFLTAEGRYQALWRWPGNQSDNYQVAPADGWIDAPQEPSALRVEALDFFGNTATVEMPIEPDGSVADPVDASGVGEGSVTLYCHGTWLGIRAVFQAPEPDVPVLHVTAGERSPIPEFRRVNDRVFAAGYDPGPPGGMVVIQVTHPRITAYTEQVAVFIRGTTSEPYEVAGLTVKPGINSAFGALFARIHEMPEAKASGDLMKLA